MSSVLLLNTRLPGTIRCSQVRISRGVALPAIGKRSHVRVMTLDLTDGEAALLLKELNGIIDEDRYFLSTASRP
jgi:hypothetical protein